MANFSGKHSFLGAKRVWGGDFFNAFFYRGGVLLSQSVIGTPMTKGFLVLVPHLRCKKLLPYFSISSPFFSRMGPKDEEDGSCCRLILTRGTRVEKNSCPFFLEWAEWIQMMKRW